MMCLVSDVDLDLDLFRDINDNNFYGGEIIN